MDSRVVVSMVVVLALLIGFAAGFLVERQRMRSAVDNAKHKTKVAAGAPTSTTATTAKPTAAELAGLTAFRKCMRQHGVDLPAVSGTAALQAQLQTPPSGVNRDKFDRAVTICYKNSATSTGGSGA
jgi:hypothetical protein